MFSSEEILGLEANERWYLVQTLARHERKAHFHLAAQGFKIFLPEYLKAVRHARKLSSVRSALFPGYLFVGLDLSRDRWLCVRSTAGVLRLYSRRDGTPTAVPLGVVEAVMARSQGGLIRLDDGLHAGQEVRILSGPFADFVGNLKKINDAGRVEVLLQMMGSVVPVVLKRSALAPAA